MPTLTATVDPADMARLKRKLEKSTPSVLEPILRDAAPYVRDQAKAGAPVQTGALVGSLVSEASGLEARIHSPIEYALPQEFGRRGGRGPAGRFFLRRAVQMLTNTELPRLFKKAITALESGWGQR